MKRKTDPGPRLWRHDRKIARVSGLICGIDEVGRGPLAGNVMAACVVLDLNAGHIPGLNDSKQLTPQARKSLFPVIRERALAWSIGEASPEEIDRVNILQATFLAMRRALESLSLKPALLLVDGNKKIPGVDVPQKTMVGGDGLSASIAASSVLAKVIRDGIMEEWDKRLPAYGFGRHKGYGTREHCNVLLQLGLSSIHRRSFCSAFGP